MTTYNRQMDEWRTNQWRIEMAIKIYEENLRRKAVREEVTRIAQDSGPRYMMRSFHTDMWGW